MNGRWSLYPMWAWRHSSRNVFADRFSITSQEYKSPFAYLGLCVHFNGVDIEESNTHIMLSCQSHIDWMLCAYSWNTPKSKKSKNASPLADSYLKTTFQECGLN